MSERKTTDEKPPREPDRRPDPIREPQKRPDPIQEPEKRPG